MAIELKRDAQAFMGKRDLLEDRASSFAITTPAGLDLTVVVVADGMGGEGKGERASTLTTDEFTKYLKRSSESNLVALLEAAFTAANDAVIHEIETTPGLSGMGTTLAVAVVHEGKLYIANAGDSRIYLIRKNELIQVSRDHTLETKMRLKGRDDEYIKSNRNRAKLTNHIGTPEKFYVDLGLYVDQTASTEQAIQHQGFDLLEGDKVLLCSDGLVKATRDLPQVVSNNEIVEHAAAFDPSLAIEKLGALAVSRDVGDNVSVAIIDTGGKKSRLPAQKPKLKSLLAIAGLAIVGLAAFFLLGNQEPAAIPELEDNFAFASDVRGQVQYNPAGQVNPQPVNRGDIFEAGEGATVEVVGQGYLRLGLADNSIITLGDDTKVELRQISNSAGTQVETIIYLIRGKLLVNADIPENRDFLVMADNNAIARVEGTIMGVFYDSGGQHFQVDCLEGHCVVQDSSGTEVSLTQGQYAEIFGLGDVSDIQPARYEFWQDIADRGLIFTPTPTLQDTATTTPTETPVQTGPSNDAPKPTATEERPTPTLGCTDPSASNYSPSADSDNGSCQYPGCTQSGADNYDSGANVDDGSCEFSGCTDPGADNYDSGANVDDGSCEYTVYGCTDPGADNYDSDATDDDGSCEYTILGCTDPDADNYDADATDDDGSCTYPPAPAPEPDPTDESRIPNKQWIGV